MAKYRSKRRSCGLCKPQKRGWEHKDTERQIEDEKNAQREMIEDYEWQDLHPAEVDLIEYEATMESDSE